MALIFNEIFNPNHNPFPILPYVQSYVYISYHGLMYNKIAFSECTCLLHKDTIGRIIHFEIIYVLKITEYARL